MGGKLIVHIGLPKTATTTLQQEFFPSLSSERTMYLGVLQPRTAIQSQLFRSFSEAVSKGKTDSRLLADLSALIGTGKTLLISEELFSVSTGGVTWRAKLDHLSKLVREFDYSIVVTVREPAPAIFSYYAETYSASSSKGFVGLAKTDERMEIFHYRKLVSELLARFERDRIFVHRFEDVIAGRNLRLRRLIAPDSMELLHGTPQVHNQRRLIKNTVHLDKKVTLADGPRKLVALLGIGETRLAQRIKITLRPLMRRLDEIDLFERRLRVPSKAEMERIKDHLRDETAALDEFFGIKY